MLLEKFNTFLYVAVEGIRTRDLKVLTSLIT